MSKVTKAQLEILVDQLERQVEDDRRRIGVMMYEANVMAQRIVELENEIGSTVDDADEIDRLSDIVKCQADRIKLLSQKVAAQPKRAFTAPAVKAVALVEDAALTVEVTDFDRAMYAKFKALDRSVRLAIIEFARPQFGHVGIHNIVDVRAAWHEYQQQSA